MTRTTQWTAAAMLVATGAALAATLAAGSAAAQQTRELDAHVHGVSTLDVALEGKTVTMRLAAPGVDIVGFEHEAATEEDRAAIEAAVTALEDPLTLFVPSDAAGCSVTAVSAALIAEDDHGHDHAEAAAGHDDDHAHDHDHGGTAEADGHEHEETAADAHDHDQGHEDGETAEAEGEARHSAFVADYAMTCADPEALDGIEFAFFETFPNAEKMDVQVVGRGPAQGFEVERASPVLDLGGSI